jgi:hypothetical protein
MKNLENLNNMKNLEKYVISNKKYEISKKSKKCEKS